jgi:hypothetical protein
MSTQSLSSVPKIEIEIEIEMEMDGADFPACIPRNIPQII